MQIGRAIALKLEREKKQINGKKHIISEISPILQNCNLITLFYVIVLLIILIFYYTATAI